MKKINKNVPKKDKCKKHNWIVNEKNTDWDICTECGAKKIFNYAKQATQYNNPDGSIKIVEEGMVSLDTIVNREEEEPLRLKDVLVDGRQVLEHQRIEDGMNLDSLSPYLTDSQKELLELIRSGVDRTEREMAKILNISQSTLRDRKKYIIKKGKKLLI